MKKGLTDIVLILDRSGSMAGVMNEAIGSCNSMIEDQKKVAGEARVTIAMFDHEYSLLADRTSLDVVAPLSEATCFARGTTALYDAIGRTVSTVGDRLRSLREEDRPEQVIVAVMTDGYENASREYTIEKVKSMIDHQTSKYNWKFLFLGANLDVAQVSSSIGVPSSNHFTYSNTPKSVRASYMVMSEALRGYRSEGENYDINTLASCQADVENISKTDSK